MSEKSLTPVYILLAEDNPADVYLIRQALAENHVDCHLQVARDGKEALSMLGTDGSMASAATPHLILLDINLPQHDGTEILRHIRQDARLAAVPVIVFTSSDSPADRLSATQLGAARYIKKPSLLDDFLAIGAVVREVLAAPPLPLPEN
jgi:chemotaxis family two-component system response regulator Rcp1